MPSGGRSSVRAYLMLRDWLAVAMLFFFMPTVASTDPFDRREWMMPLAFATAPSGFPATLQCSTPSTTSVLQSHTLRQRQADRQKSVNLHSSSEIKLSRGAISVRAKSFPIPPWLPAFTDQRHRRQLSKCELSANDGGIGLRMNENVEVDVLEEDFDAGEDMVSNVRDSAYALLVAALNPESDPSWDEEIELSIVLCSDDHIQALNRQWRGKDAPTDVLSFVQDSSDSGSDGILGDLVISIPTAERQAKERNHALLTELRILMVHGLLHLLGYDHEESQEELVEMADAEQRLLKRLGWEGDGLITSAS